MKHDSDALLSFWFDPPPDGTAAVAARMRSWFRADPAFDARVKSRLGPLAEAAAHGELDHWAAEARSRLALILALDQLPRNIYRGEARAFAQDLRAQALALDGLASNMDEELLPLERLFFYMPLQHSEDLTVQERSVASYRRLAQDAGGAEKSALADALHYARQHRDLIARFGRFPHRNRALGRESTPEERLFLEQGGATFGQ